MNKLSDETAREIEIINRTVSDPIVYPHTGFLVREHLGGQLKLINTYEQAKAELKGE